jgi:methionyl-tRNA formyltransferase
MLHLDATEDRPRLLIGTGTDPVELCRVQPAGKKPMPALDWWRGIAARGTENPELVAS